MTSINAGGVLTSNISASIGPGGIAGVPNQIFADLDVYHLNNRAGITPGSVIRVTLKVNSVGGDLGSKSIDNNFFPTDHPGDSTWPSLTRPTPPTRSTARSTSHRLRATGHPNTVIADNGSTIYGYDENGDFFVQFVAAGRPGPDGQTGTADDTPASYAVYVQGVFNSDYQLQVVTSGTGELVKRRQNIFIETQGGQVEWLESGGVVTSLDGYDLRALGFSGTTAGGVNVNDFVLQRIVASLQTAFDNLGFDVRISTNPAEFEFQPFSTIFLSNSVDPINLTLSTEYGYSQRSDPLNTDDGDEAVVFLSSFATLGFTPDSSGLVALSDALTAAVGAAPAPWACITVGLPSAGGVFDIMAANSPDRLFYPSFAGTSWSYLQAARSLLHPRRLGRQHRLHHRRAVLGIAPRGASCSAVIRGVRPASTHLLADPARGLPRAGLLFVAGSRSGSVRAGQARPAPVELMPVRRFRAWRYRSSVSRTISSGSSGPGAERSQRPAATSPSRYSRTNCLS